MKIRHAEVWKHSPKEKNIFVSKVVPKILPKLRKDRIKTILDAACGNGMGATVPLLLQGFEVKAFDNAESALAAVRQNARDAGCSIEAKKGDMYGTWPYRNASFDAVLCFKAMHHGRLEDMMKAMSEAKRVMRKGGHFYATLVKDELKYDTQKKTHYFFATSHVTGKKIKAFAKQDKTEPHLFYYLSRVWEYMVPHYFASREELKVILGMYFTKVNITHHQEGPYANFWLIHCVK